MPTALKRTISLPPQQAEYVDSLVASGAYADESEVVKAGVEALRDREAALEE
jgi:antitoxin ParD1/3/4